MTVVLVCGRRDYTNSLWFDVVMGVVHEEVGISLIIQGGATGADALAKEWARKAGIPCRQYDIDWNRYGRSAGLIRNQRMLSDGKPDLVVAFPGRRGTSDMILRAERAGVKVQKEGYVVNPPITR